MTRDKKNWIIVSLISVFLNLAPYPTSAQEMVCEQLMQHNLFQSLKNIHPEITKAKLNSELCSKSDEGSAFLLDSTLKVSPAQFKASKDLFCSKKRKVKKNFSNQRVLKGLLGTDQLTEYKKCINLAKQGIQIESELSENDKILNIAANFTKANSGLSSVNVKPAEAFNCSGPLASQADQKSFNSSALYGICERNPVLQDIPAVITVKTPAGSVNINVAPVSPAFAINNIGRINPANIPTMPNIQGCEILSAIDRTMSCNEIMSFNMCNNFLRSGEILDCRFVFRDNIGRNRVETHFRPARGTYQLRTSGRLGVTIYRNNPDAGIIAGNVNYTINFNTPILAQRSAAQCDPSCPLFGESPCNRECVFADHVVELPSYGGVASLSREDGDSCSQPVTGNLELDTIDKYRAYNLCEAQNAWGRTTTGIMYAQVSKFYYFNDFRTTHTLVTGRRNGRNVREERWEVSNQGERVRGIAELEIPFTIACND